MNAEPDKNKVFVISELYYPEDTSTGYFITKIAEGLAERCPVEAICSKPTYSERHLDVPFLESHRGVEIRRVRSTRMNKDRIIGRFVNLVTFTLGAAWSFARSVRSGDIVICLTNPPPLPLLIGVIAKLKKAHSVILVHDLYPEVLVATGHLSSQSMAYRVLYKIFAVTYRLFDRIIVLGRDMQELVARKIGGQGQAPLIIPNWGDVDDVYPIERSANHFAQEHGLVQKTVIQFSGNLGRTHDLETVMRAAKLLQDEPDIVFLFVGYGGKAHLIDQLSGGGNLPNVRFLPRQPREALGAMLACSDATVIAFVDEMLGVSVPSRMYNIMAAGVPIIAMCDRRSELAQTVDELDCGWVLGTGDEAGLARLVRQIHRAKTAGPAADATLKGLNGREGAESRFNRMSVVAEFQGLVESISMEISKASRSVR
jgi:colanic acid biosynthesis glycosyl transferase WcaI